MSNTDIDYNIVEYRFFYKRYKVSVLKIYRDRCNWMLVFSQIKVQRLDAERVPHKNLG